MVEPRPLQPSWHTKHPLLGSIRHANQTPEGRCFSSWWLNQPIWKHISQNGNLPQIGVKIKKYLKPPPIFLFGPKSQGVLKKRSWTCLAAWEHVWWLMVIIYSWWFQPIGKNISIILFMSGGGKNFKKLLKPPSWLWSRWWLNHLNKYASKWTSDPPQIRMSGNAYQHQCRL